MHAKKRSNITLAAFLRLVEETDDDNVARGLVRIELSAAAGNQV
jgi:hypothetical protein